MRNNLHIRLLTVLSICFVFFACTNRPKEVLSSNNMANVITDLHKADGALTIAMRTNPDIDAKEYYASVLNRYKLTQSEFDSSLVWYTKNPKRFETVYLKVEDNLKEWQKDLKAGKFGIAEQIFTTTLWERPSRTIASDSAGYAQTYFNIENASLLYQDVYLLRFIQKIEAKDSTQSPLISMKINYEDGLVDSVLVNSHADSLTRQFTIQMVAKHPAKVKSVSGELLVPKSFDKELTVVFDSIKLTRKYNYVMQDSLQKIVDKTPKQKIETTPKIEDNKLLRKLEEMKHQ